MEVSNIFAVISFLTLLAVTNSHNNHHDHHPDNHDGTDWIKFLPGMEHFLKNRTTDVLRFEADSTFKYKETYTTEALFNSSITVNGTSNSTVTPMVMSGTTYYDSNRNKIIYIPAGSIVLLILLCCCCCKCCCGKSKEVQGVIIQTAQPQPLQQVTIQNFNPAQPPAPPPQYQPVYNVSPPPPQQWQQQQLQQQQWSPHQPMNPYMEQHSPQSHNDPYNPSAPPTYGKY